MSTTFSLVRPARERRVAVAVVLTVVLVLTLTACGGSGAVGSTAIGAVAPADASTCVGPRTATAQDWVAPLTPAPRPQLPVTVTDVTGLPVTITDADRILALDTYGTLGTTVYALGLGDRLVGRDVSTGVPELADLPVVTGNGHELNAEAILELDPDVILTDYSIGPLEVQLQLRDAGIPVVVLDDHRARATIGDQIRAAEFAQVMRNLVHNASADWSPASCL